MTQHLVIAKGSDSLSTGFPISAMVSLCEALDKIGMDSSAIYAPQSIVLVADGLGIVGSIGEPSSISCPEGLFVSLPSGSGASVEREGGRVIHMSSPTGCPTTASTHHIDETALRNAARAADPLAIDWLATGRRGQSSDALCRQLFKVPKTASAEHPRDPADLERCISFLEATRSEQRIAEAASISPEWAALVSRWDELTTLLVREWPTGSAPACFKAMSEALATAEPRRRGPAP